MLGWIAVGAVVIMIAAFVLWLRPWIDEYDQIED
jgi:hypothetical protein